jgi:exosortase H (IPTLxxWG-CTERM-specific)
MRTATKLLPLKWNFLAGVAVVGALYVLQLHGFVHRAVVQAWTDLIARTTSTLLVAFDDDVVSVGNVIQSRSSNFSVSIDDNCNGLTACAILFAGIVAFPASWRQKVDGLWIGMVAVQAVNLVRIIGLYYVGTWDSGLFGFVHVYAGQALMIMVVAAFWLRWIRSLR